jgi:hypothetical protein
LKGLQGSYIWLKKNVNVLFILLSLVGK